MTDGQESVNTAFSWTITQVNLAPVISNPGNQLNTEGDALSLQLSASDANGDNLVYSANGLPNALAINVSTGLISGTLSLTSSGNYTISVTVSDGVLTDSVNFAWNVNNLNQPPVITVPADQSNTEGESVSLNVNAFDPDGDSISYTANGLPSGLSINSSTGLVSGVLATGIAGNYAVSVTASDGLLSDTGSFNWVITPVSNNTNWLQTLVVNGVNSSNWTTVNLNHSYNSLVAVCTVNYQNNSLPEVVRMSNVGSNSFDIQLQNPSGSTLSAEAVHCIAIEEGSWTLDDGRKIEAQKLNSTITDNRSSWTGQSTSYLASYTTPVVVGQVMSYNDPDWSSFWSRGSSRGAPATANNLFVGKHVAEDSDTTRSNETLGFIVMEAGVGTANNVAYETQRGADTVRDLNKAAVSYSYTQSFSGTPEVAIASQTAMDGNNGSWAVLRAANPLSGGGITLMVDEDQIRDTERNHTTEQVMYMVFESASEMELTPNP